MNRQLIILVLLALIIVLSGCKITSAIAREKRHATDRADNWHAEQLETHNALQPTKVLVTEIMLYTLMVGGVIYMLVVTGGASYFTTKFFTAKAAQAHMKFVNVDPLTRQLPVVIYKNRVVNLETGERLLLIETEKTAKPERIEASNRVKIAGVLAQQNESTSAIKVINAISSGGE